MEAGTQEGPWLVRKGPLAISAQVWSFQLLQPNRMTLVLLPADRLGGFLDDGASAVTAFVDRHPRGHQPHWLFLPIQGV